jgi:hypothetical protein
MPVRLPPVIHRPTAYAVLFLDAHRRPVGRGVFSEPTPTIGVGGTRGTRARSTVVLASARSRTSFDRAILRVLEVMETDARWQRAPSIGHADSVAKYLAERKRRPRVALAQAV